MADMVRRPEHREPLFILPDDRAATARVHHAVAGKDSRIFGEEVSDRGEIVVVDREAGTRGERATGAFGFQPVDASGEIIVDHRRSMAKAPPPGKERAS